MDLKTESQEPRSLNGVDRMFKKLSEACADHVSRRSLLFHLATGAAAFVGAKFAVPVIADSFLGRSLAAASMQAATCTHGAGCEDTGRKCGMHASVDCKAYQNCANCWNTETGCPKGATNGGSWTTCCHCLETPGTKEGHYFNFNDCCTSKANPLHKDCASRICQDRVKGSGCKTNNYPCNGPQMANVVPWCGVNNGKPICTWSENTNIPCNS